MSKYEDFDFFRVREWALDNNRKPAWAAFTAGTNRNVAYLLEELFSMTAGAKVMFSVEKGEVAANHVEIDMEQVKAEAWEFVLKEARFGCLKYDILRAMEDTFQYLEQNGYRIVRKDD